MGCVVTHGGVVAHRIGRRTFDREVMGSSPGCALLRDHLRQVVHTLVPLSSNSLIWYLCKNLEGDVTAGDEYMFSRPTIHNTVITYLDADLHYATSCFIDVVDPCQYTWTSQANANAQNGIRVSTASTVDQCQWACIRHATCTGVDFNPSAAATQQCWMSGPWSGPIVSGSGFTHYEWNRNCKIHKLFAS